MARTGRSFPGLPRIASTRRVTPAPSGQNFTQTLSAVVNLATVVNKFYFHNATTVNTGTMPSSTTIASVGPNLTATGASTNRTMDGNPGNVEVNIVGNAITAGQTQWMCRFVSPPLAAQTLQATGPNWSLLGMGTQTTGNIGVDGVIAGFELIAWRPSNGTTIATISNFSNPGGTGTHFTGNKTIFANGFSGIAATIQDGDILVLEIWINAGSGNTQSLTSTVFFDDIATGSYLQAIQPIILLNPQAPVKTVGKIITYASTLAISIVKGISKSISVTENMAATILKNVGHILVGSSTLAVSYVRNVGKILTGTITGSPTFQRAIAKLITVAETLSSSAIKGATTVKTTSIAITPSLLKNAGKRLSTAVTATPTFSTIKKAVLTLTGTITGTALLLKNPTKIIPSAITMTLSLPRLIGKTLTAALTGTTIIPRAISYTKTIAVSLTLSLTKAVSKAITAAATAAASILTGRAFFRSLTASVVMSVTRSNSIGKIFSNAITISLSISKTINKIIVQSILIALIDLKNVVLTAKALTINIAATVARSFPKILTVAVALTPTIGRNIAKLFTRTLSFGVSIGISARQKASSITTSLRMVGFVFSSNRLRSQGRFRRNAIEERDSDQASGRIRSGQIEEQQTHEIRGRMRQNDIDINE